jgi:acyl dehydratase
LGGTVRYFEDYEIGKKIVTPGRTITEADASLMMGICRYSEPVMIDEEFAKKTIFGGTILPGRAVIALAGGLLVLAQVFDDDTTICGLGISKVDFTGAVRVGDTIRSEVEFIGKRETSKLDRGTLTHRETCRNQRGETVLIIEETHLVKRRPAE